MVRVLSAPLRIFLMALALLAFVASVRAMPRVLTNAENNAVPACVTPERLNDFLRARNPRVEERYLQLAGLYARDGAALGLRWDYAYFHMLLETGDLTFQRAPNVPGPVAPEQNNLANLGAAGPGVAGESFETLSAGVRAHLEHLLIYAGVRIANPTAERTRRVQEWAVLEPWRAKLGRPVTFGDLALRWKLGQESYVRKLSSLATAFFERNCQSSRKSVVAAAMVRPPQLARGWSADQPPAQGTSSGREPASGGWRVVAKPAPSRLGSDGVPRDADRDGRERRPGQRRVEAPRAQANPKTVAITPVRRVAGAQVPEPGSAPQHEPEKHPLETLVSGQKVRLTMAMGATIPIEFRADGQAIGHANGYSFFLGSRIDHGKWWVEDDMLCIRWRVWLDREKNCIRVVKRSGGTIHWRSATGKTGTARIVGS